MAVDRARRSYDPARLYRSVLSQQGRVTLEADENEEDEILAEERRLELIDIVGPCGTPDDGYAVSGGGSLKVEIGPGTMYVGGNRVELDEAIEYGKQPDRLDQSSDPDVKPGSNEIGGNEHVVLVLTETDVTAVEDPALREAALGGPDTSARMRLLQRVHRYPARGDDCAEALKLDMELWEKQGLTYDPATAELSSNGRLLVEWDPPEGPVDPCQPSAKGGYLGAENQAVRVQVSAVKANGTFDLLWGWDNASFLYRVTADESTKPILTLDRSPVDDFHRPRAGQAVQVLRSAAALESTDDVVEGYVAALTGEAGVLTAPYDPDTKTVQFPSALPADYTDEKATPQLFLRVWEELLTGNKPGDEVSLPGTGLIVVLTVDGGGPVHEGDFWTIGVRPSTPDTVLPARLLRTPQPPDGARMWACPLAVIGWNDGILQLLDDCRHPFKPLTELEGGDCCCTVSVEPSDHTEHGLQAIIDKAAAGRPLHDPPRVTICLRPGRYELERPLVLRRQHGRLHLEGCGGEGVELAVKAGHEEAFGQGLIILAHADRVRITGLELHLPQVPAAQASITKQQKELSSFQKPVDAVYRALYVSIGIRPVHCAQLAIEDCLFRFTVGDAAAGQDVERNVFGAGIFAGSECWGMRLERNRFLHEPPHEPKQTQRTLAGKQTARAHAPVGGEVQHTLVGLLLVPSLVYKQGDQGLPSASLLRSLLVGGRIVGNEFNGLSVAIVAFAELGDVRIEDNRIRDCYAGIWLLSLRAQAFAGLAGKYTVASNLVEGTLKGLRAVMVEAAANPTLQQVSVVGRTYPLPDEFLATASEKLAAKRAEAKRPVTDQVEWTQQFVQQAVAPFQQAQVRTKAGKTPEAEAKTETFALAAPKPATPRAVTTEQLHVALSDFERAVALEPAVHGFELRVTGNDVECAVGEAGDTGAALMVWNTDLEVETSALVSDNRMSGLAEGPVAALLGVAEVLTNGNYVRNRQQRGLSLALVATTDVAVAGNILRGVPLLPVGRPFPAPLSNWLPLNTVHL